MVLIGDAEKRMVAWAALKKSHGHPRPKAFETTGYSWCPPDLTATMTWQTKKVKSAAWLTLLLFRTI
jgi:hypothetical protein